MIRLIHQLLARSPVYRFGMRMLGGDSVIQKHISTYVRPEVGDRVLDLGCGPADMLNLLPEIDYVGVDFEADYIQHASARYGSRGKFIHQDVTTIDPAQFGQFDIVLATALLHHLNDDEADQILSTAKRMLKPTGRLITYDGCFLNKKQHPIDLWMLKNDRGKFVRSQKAYLELVQKYFPNVDVHIRQDLLRIPYTLIIMECSLTAPSGTSSSKVLTTATT